MFNENDADTSLLENNQIAVLGYGRQGKAQALNLRESGANVTLGLRAGGKSWKQAEQDGWQPETVQDAVKKADVIAFLTPDMTQEKLYQEQVKDYLKPGATLLFSHGFNIHYKLIKPDADLDVVMIAPKSPGHLVREEFCKGAGVPCLLAVDQDYSGSATEKALAYAHGIGGTRAGVLQTTFKEETETDLFGEQAVLCGGAVELVKAGWETLVEAGYQKELAYYECMHELKLIVDLFYQGGISLMHKFVSDTANYGALTRGNRIVDQQTREHMRSVLKEIQDGKFAREWMDEYENGANNFQNDLQQSCLHPIESTGAKLREQMSWLQRE